jgi:hypothetical protein
MSDDFERELRDQLEREARQASRFPDPLRARILDAIEPRRRLGLTQQLALAGALLVFVALLAVGVAQLRGFKGGPLPAATPTPSASVAPSAAPSATPTSRAYVCGEQDGGDSVPGSLVRVAIAHHPGYDRIVFEFADSSKIPTYRIVPQDNAHFVRDASGQPVNLRGSAGLRIVFQNATGQGTWNGTVGGQGSTTVVTDVAQLGDFERVLSFGVGLTQGSCLSVSRLDNPGRLVIDVQTP